MLEDLRKKQKAVIIIVAFVFIVGMAVMGVDSVFRPKPYVGTIMGKKIMFNEYDKMYREQIEAYTQQNPNAQLDDRTLQMINDQTWQQLVQKTILDKQLKKMHIKITDADVVNKLKNDPPQVIKTHPELQTNGNFDMDKYLTLLTTNEMFAKQLESYVRAVLPYEKLEQKVKEQANITLDSVRVEYTINNDRVDAKVIWFDPAKAPAVTVTDNDIKAYYDQNKEKSYKKEPARRLKVVAITMQPSLSDIKKAKSDIDDVYKRIQAGEDFAVLARDFSQDPGSAQNGGDLGYVTKGKMVKEFDDVVFSLKPGEISKPFKTQFGWHIVKVGDSRLNDKKELEVKASHILIQIEPSEKTKSDTKLRADEFYSEAKSTSVEQAAKKFKYEVQETPEFDKKAQYIPGMGRLPHIIQKSFKKGVGYLFEPQKIYDGSYVIAEISAKLGVHYEDLASVKDRIRFDLEREKKAVLMQQKAKEFTAKYKPAQYLAEAVKEGYQIIDAKNINSKLDIPGVGPVPELNKAMLALNTNQLTNVVTNKLNGAFIAQIVEHRKPDMAAFEKNKASLFEDLKYRKGNQHYSEWFQKLYEEANIEDYRYRYY